MQDNTTTIFAQETNCAGMCVTQLNINVQKYEFIKADQLHSLKKFCILPENVIFHEQIRTPQAASLLVKPFGTQSSS